MYEVRFGETVRELCEGLAGGIPGGIKAVQIGGPLGGILPSWKLDTAFDFDALAAEGCMVGHGSIVGFDERTDMRALARHLLRFGAHESCGKCFPCRIGLRRAHEMFEADAPVDRARLEDLLEALELGSLCAHGGGMPAPIRSLLEHFPEELGLSVMRVAVDGIELEVQPGASVLEAVERAGGRLPTLCYDDRLAPFGACRTCLVGLEGAPAPVPACTTRCREGMRIDTRDATAARVVRTVVELVLSELERAAGAEHRAGQGRRLARDSRAAASRAPPTRSALDERHPYLAFRHELCISCGRCVRACDEVQGAFALTVTGRGFHSNVTAGLDSGFQDSSCVSCGACADTCPTGAIIERRLLTLERERDDGPAGLNPRWRPRAGTAASAAAWRPTWRTASCSRSRRPGRDRPTGATRA